MLELVPMSGSPGHYAVRRDGQEIAEFSPSSFLEDGELTIDGASYELHRDTRDRALTLLRGGVVVARAHKPSAFRNLFQVEHDGQTYEVEKAGLWSRRFEVRGAGRTIGAVSPRDPLTRHSAIDLPADLGLAMAVFVAGLVTLLWDRDVTSPPGAAGERPDTAAAPGAAGGPSTHEPEDPRAGGPMPADPVPDRPMSAGPPDRSLPPPDRPGPPPADRSLPPPDRPGPPPADRPVPPPDRPGPPPAERPVPAEPPADRPAPVAPPADRSLPPPDRPGPPPADRPVPAGPPADRPAPVAPAEPASDPPPPAGRPTPADPSPALPTTTTPARRPAVDESPGVQARSAAATEVVISTEGLVKDYGDVRALAGVNLEVRRGEIFGFLGPNGAGKSTTIRVLLDLLRPTAGRAEVFGVPPRQGGPALRSRIGYLPGELAMAGRKTAGELLGDLVRLRDGAGADRIGPLAERFTLDLDRPIRALSKGNKQKVGIVQAFMHSPELLVLDEPTSGLDPLLQRSFLDLLVEERGRGTTVFMSSHVLSEVQEVADRVAVIRAGQVIDLDDVETLRHRAGQAVELRFGQPVRPDRFERLPFVDDVRVERWADGGIEGATLRCLLRGEPDALLKAAAGYRVLYWSAADRELEDLFLDLYRTPPEERGGVEVAADGP